MKKIEEFQNVNKKKNRFSIQEVKESIKRQRNCSFSGDIHLY